MFEDKSGRKVSKSVGNVITIQDWLTYASPESVRLLMFKRIVGARSISVDDVPVYMDEFDELEEHYFSKKKDPNAMKDARLRGLYEYTQLLRVPAKASFHAPYRLLAELSTAAPEGAVEDYVVKRLTSYGMLKEAPGPELLTRIRKAAAWAKRKGANAQGGEPALELTEKQAKAVLEFASAIRSAKNADDVQGAAFNAIRSNDIQPGEFFPAVYGLLLGAEKGPRLGPYVVDSGPEVVAAKLEKLASATRTSG
jgi:lysyl-tRNA synthetase class 1